MRLADYIRAQSSFRTDPLPNTRLPTQCLEAELFCTPWENEGFRAGTIAALPNRLLGNFGAAK
jgi:hypothetical protein